MNTLTIHRPQICWHDVTGGLIILALVGLWILLEAHEHRVQTRQAAADQANYEADLATLRARFQADQDEADECPACYGCGVLDLTDTDGRIYCFDAECKQCHGTGLRHWWEVRG